MDLEVLILIFSRFCAQMNDYIAAYHDAVLLFKQVMRTIWKMPSSDIQDMESVSMNYFRNVSFKGRKLWSFLIILDLLW